MNKDLQEVGELDLWTTERKAPGRGKSMCKCGVFLGYLRKNQDASGTGAVGIAEGEGERVDTFREVIGPQII